MVLTNNTNTGSHTRTSAPVFSPPRVAVHSTTSFGFHDTDGTTTRLVTCIWIWSNLHDQNVSASLDAPLRSTVGLLVYDGHTVTYIQQRQQCSAAKHSLCGAVCRGNRYSPASRANSKHSIWPPVRQPFRFVYELLSPDTLGLLRHDSKVFRRPPTSNAKKKTFSQLAVVGTLLLQNTNYKSTKQFHLLLLHKSILQIHVP